MRTLGKCSGFVLKTKTKMTKHLFPYRWTLADANFTKDKGKVFSCFACGGGSTMGYKLAGFDVLGCNEIDEKMITPYKKNHNPKFAFHEPIQTFKLRDDLPSELFDLDILDGSPPCSSFSMAGNREDDWGKEKKFREGQSEQILDELFFDFIDLAHKLKPKVVVAENVEGMLMGEAKAYVRRVYDAFDKIGYTCEHHLLDASVMGVPQKRKRVFFICLRKDLADKFMVQKDMFTFVPKIDLTFNEPPILFGDVRTENGKDYSHTERAELMRYRIESDKCIADINLRRHQKNSGFNSMIIHDNQVRGTITAGEKDWRHYDGMACSDEDYMLCGSYLLDYEFMSKSKKGPKYMIGMSVPPVMTAQVATRIYDQWLSKL